jgi:photoactive yellow protein
MVNPQVFGAEVDIRRGMSRISRTGVHIVSTLLRLDFVRADLHAQLDACTDQDLDNLDFGVIGFDDEGNVRRYNALESQMAGLSRDRVLEMPLFTGVAPCLNNFLVAQRFEDAAADSSTLDDVIDYVFTLRMRPVRVKLRLLSSSDHHFRYVVVRRGL